MFQLRRSFVFCVLLPLGVLLFGTLFGSIIMFKNLLGHIFGNFQSKMFPAYFMVVSVSTATSVAAFGYLHQWTPAPSLEKYMSGFLLSALGFFLSNLLVFTCMTIEMVKKTHNIERELSISEKVGWWKNMEVAKADPRLKTVNNKLRMIHALSSCANILSFASLAVHSWCLARKISL